MSSINECPMCGSPTIINSGGVVECYGWDWQTISIECTNTMGKHCGMEVTISADHSRLNNSWEQSISFWNSLSKQ